MKKLILGLLICLPVEGWGASLHYALDIQISYKKQKVIATARLKTNSDKRVVLSMQNLSKLKVDGNAEAPAADGSLNLTMLKGKERLISYEILFSDAEANFIDKDHIFLNERWYPQPDVLAEYALTVTLPKNFIAVSEAEVIKIKQHNETKTFSFEFNHPLQSLHLMASTRYVLKKDRYNDVDIEAYFLKEEEKLADTYIVYAKEYLNMYEAMLTPYPYQRFAIVKNIFPVTSSRPTYTLVGSHIVSVPLISKNSLGHEILYQWFGSSVYLDFNHGDWVQGITTYLAEYHYATLKNKGLAYRKQIMVEYDAYVNENNAMSLTDFYGYSHKPQSASFRGKMVMLFHGLRERYGDETFFASLREFIQQNSFRKASWHDIQRAFEKVTGEMLYAYFTHWLTRNDIPHIRVKDAHLQVEQGQLKLNFTLSQQTEAYPLHIPVTLYSVGSKSQRFVDVKASEENISLTLDELPTKVVIDENYAFMRRLHPEEMPPTLASVIGKDKLIVVVSSGQRARYQPLIEALGVKDITYVTPKNFTFSQMTENSFLIAGYDNIIVDTLFGKQAIPEDGVRLKVYHNPYNEAERIVLFHVKNKAEAQATKQRLSSYSKYTELAFNGGQATYEAIAESNNGIQVLTRPASRIIKPDELASLDDILPKLINSRIIYIGEKHDRFAHHFNQLEVIKKLHKAGYKLAVGMEMFQMPYQKAIDDYLAGRIDERKFLKDSQYLNNWRYDYNLYKPIIDYLKQQNIPLIALNIEGDIPRKVAREGIYSLKDKERKQVPFSMDFTDEQYRFDLKRVFTFHREQKEIQDFNYFLQAQTLWDESMAESAQQFLKAKPEHKLIVLAGNGHIRHKYGIPERLYRRNHEPFTVIVQDEEIEDGVADYILLTTELEGKQAPQLGILVEEKDQGLVVREVSDISPAAKAGLQKGDIIRQFAGQSIESLADLKLALFYSQMGSTVSVQVERDGKGLVKEIELLSFGQLSQPSFVQKHGDR